MPTNEQPDRTKVTFSQAEGLEPLPRPLQLGELSEELRSLLWRLIFEELQSSSSHPTMTGHRYLEEAWFTILYEKHVELDHLSADEYDNDLDDNVEATKRLITKGAWNKVFDFLQFVMRHRECPYKFSDKIDAILRRARAAYTVIRDGPTIMPAATPEEGAAIRNAFDVLSDGGFDGARAHLRASADALNEGDYAGSVRESIHAVESVARRLNADASTSLAPALRTLEQHIALHPALREGFKKIYGYTSDESGIRHALLEGQAGVDLEDAVFMIGACASFTTYLIGKARRSGLLKDD